MRTRWLTLWFQSLLGGFCSLAVTIINPGYRSIAGSWYKFTMFSMVVTSWLSWPPLLESHMSYVVLEMLLVAYGLKSLQSWENKIELSMFKIYTWKMSPSQNVFYELKWKTESLCLRWQADHMSVKFTSFWPFLVFLQPLPSWIITPATQQGLSPDTGATIFIITAEILPSSWWRHKKRKDAEKETRQAMQ